LKEGTFKQESKVAVVFPLAEGDWRLTKFLSYLLTHDSINLQHDARFKVKIAVFNEKRLIIQDDLSGGQLREIF